MADTFSNDLRLRLQESGSNAGTWGDLLNGTITNIASGFGQGSEAIPNASTHTITLADGTADEARSLYLKCTGGGQACTVTLGPNTISKVWIIDNATSYTLTFSQGSGANVAIAAGAVKVIATDGAGSGAAVVDTLDGLEGSLSSLAVTGAVTADGLTVDGAATIDGGATDNTVLTLDSGTANTYLKITDSNSTNGTFIGATTNDLNFYPNNSLAVTMTASGSVGIGTSSPRTLVNASSATGAILTLESSDTSLTTNGVIGGIDFYSNDSSTNGTGAKVNIRAIGQNSSGTATALTFGTSSSGSATAVEAMRIDASGNVGIGTSSPSTKLHLGGTAPLDSIIRQDSTVSGTNWEIGEREAGKWQIFEDDSDSVVATFTSSGNVGIGTSSPYASSSWNRVLHVQSAGTGSSIRLADSVSGTSGEVGLLVGQYSNDAYFVNRDSGGVSIWANNTERLSITSVGAIFATGVRSSSAANSDLRYNTSNGEIYYQTSSERYKSNIADLEFDTSNLYNLRPVSFDDNENGERCFGLLAEETFEQIPEAVVTRDIDGETVPDSIPYSMLSVLIINEMKKLKVENDSLKARLTALENN